jgi:hypothetical protein
VKIGERKIVRLGEGFMLSKESSDNSLVRADGGEANAFGHQCTRRLHHTVDDGFDVRAVVAHEDDHRASGPGDIL